MAAPAPLSRKPSDAWGKKLRHREGKALSHPGRRPALGAGASSPAHLQLSLRNQRIACAKSLAGAKQDRVRQLRAAAGAAQSQTQPWGRHRSMCSEPPKIVSPVLAEPRTRSACSGLGAAASRLRAWLRAEAAVATRCPQALAQVPDPAGRRLQVSCSPGAASWT